MLMRIAPSPVVARRKPITPGMISASTGTWRRLVTETPLGR
jgi:hypothetical protein